MKYCDDQIQRFEMNDINEKQNTSSYDGLCDLIREKFEEEYGSIEIVYPSIVKYLFTGDNLDKQSHKQMFWRLFGNIAVQTLEENLVACRICPQCGTHIPIWSKHTCGKAQKKMLVCETCGKTVVRINGKQKMCSDCAANHRRDYMKQLMANRRKTAV